MAHKTTAECQAAIENHKAEVRAIREKRESLQIAIAESFNKPQKVAELSAQYSALSAQLEAAPLVEAQLQADHDLAWAVEAQAEIVRLRKERDEFAAEYDRLVAEIPQLQAELDEKQKRVMPADIARSRRENAAQEFERQLAAKGLL